MPRSYTSIGEASRRQGSSSYGRKFHYLFIASSHGTRILSCKFIAHICLAGRPRWANKSRTGLLRREGVWLSSVVGPLYRPLLCLARVFTPEAYASGVLGRRAPPQHPWR